MTQISRGTVIGERIGAQPIDEAEHFWRCEACGGYFDMRDLGAVLDHEGAVAASGLRSSAVDPGRQSRDLFCHLKWNWWRPVAQRPLPIARLEE